MSFTALWDATAISTILSNTNTLSDIHTDIAHNHTDISTMQGNVTTILGTTNTLSDIHTDVGSAIADIAAVHTHVHSLPTSFAVSGIASVQRGNGTTINLYNSGCQFNISISSVNMSKSVCYAYFYCYQVGNSNYVNAQGSIALTSSTNIFMTATLASLITGNVNYYWEVLTFA